MFKIAVYYALAAWPVARIFRRAGFGARHARWLLPALVVPMLAPMLVLMVLGHARWPNLPPGPLTPPRKARREA